MTPAGLLRPSARRLVAWTANAHGLTHADLQRRYDLNQLQRLEAILNRHGRSFRRCASILEFGCGAGRLARCVADLAPQAAISGCDVEPEGIRQCRRRCPRGRFVVNQWAPPLDMADEAFDVLYSYSVFTHLSEANHLAWLTELARLVRPGGVMLHTVHSYEYLRRTACFSPRSLDKYRLPGSIDAFIASGLEYFYAVEDPAAPEYGHTIIRKEYVISRWPQATGMTLLESMEGAIESYPEGCQDVVLLAKEAA